ncbi:glycosyltransferase family protein [Mucilaginibacter polytrichastri]|uniref:Glycosyltransferase subfamily 4-like N-terminal domain-containing protein n=1 Tax=Mucilaginibacter polytrichastri TaxID=1302689 RepID=A0A1Q5ZTX8_9SPHI|nr:hypothetical protein [Mucilaginibacter polytrichastri]OKS85138.1 hypothetical protein RG47T_0582 [Mucilaginibacter polytrichastri]SFS43904.1 Glycosyltransferase involved in cell wall bisynthesis [Mucilaginibacter polytrichastri]
MKIAFLCGGLEPGKDGVGDYTRRLAKEFQQNNHEVVVISLADRHINKIAVGSQVIDGVEVSTLRIPHSLEKKYQFKEAEKYLKIFDPDWISFQYVPYSFDKRALPINLGKKLKKLRPFAKWSIMFHEIWQGESIESTIKDKIIGYFQKRITLGIISKLKPVFISTTNEYYKKCFSNLGIQTDKIPVFSNIPAGSSSPGKIFMQLPKSVLDNKANYVIASFFGGFHAYTELGQQLNQVAKTIEDKLGKKLMVTHIGKADKVKEVLDNITKTTNIETAVLGEWDEYDVADYLSTIDLGLSTYPKILYEKSGSIAALLINGCPVILFKESFEQDNRQITELKEWSENFDFKKFFDQDKSFSALYGAKEAFEKYLKNFNQ